MVLRYDRFPFARYPALRFLLLYAVGLYAGPASPAAAAAVLALVAVAELLLRRRLSGPRYAAALAGHALAVMALGALTASWHGPPAGPETGPAWAVDAADTLRFIGTVVQAAPTASGRAAFVLDLPASVRLRLSADSLAFATVRPGARVAAEVRLSDPPLRRNPHGFDYGAWLGRQGVSATGRLTAPPLVLEPPPRFSIANLRHRVAETARSLVQPEQQALIQAILLGRKAELDPEDRTAFARSGLSHLMAVSGMHVGFLVAPIWWLIPWLWRYRHGRLASLILLALVLVAYATLTGFTASVNRAALMALLFAGGRLFEKTQEPVNILAVAATVLLTFDPGQIHDIGFQLSFLAVGSLMTVLPVFRNSIPYRHTRRWYGKLLLFLLVSVTVQVALYPVLAWHFGEFSLIGPIANLIGVPATEALFLYGFAALPLAALFPEWALLIGWPADQLARILLWTASTTADWPAAWISVPRPDVMTVILWGAAAAVVTAWPHFRRRWIWVRIFLALWVVDGCLDTAASLIPQPLELRVLDVGQGDATLIRTPGGRTILIDTGVYEPGRTSGKDVILPDLFALRIRKLDLVVLSHPHADHTGGMHDLLRGIPISRIVVSGFPHRTALELGWRQLARERKVPVENAVRGTDISPDPALSLLVLHPGTRFHGTDPNPHSVVLRLTYGSTRFLFTGDADAEAEDELVAIWDDWLQADWLKAGHHGSRTSSTDVFLETVAPDHVAVSLAWRNRYRHPHAEAVHRLYQTGADVRFTSREGALLYRSDGTTITRIHWRP